MSSVNISNILKNYESENIGVRRSLYQILSHGELGGTGKVVILPVDQGMEHGAINSFEKNDLGYDPSYHINLAISAKVSAYATTLGMIEAGLIGDVLLSNIPMILKLNHANILNPEGLYPDQSIIASVDDALRLGCVGIGLTIYPGSGKCNDMLEEARELIKEAKSKGLIAVVWSYPRGGDLAKWQETSVGVISYGAHIASSIGATIVKVKLPTAGCDKSGAPIVKNKLPESNDIINQSIHKISWQCAELDMVSRVKKVVQSCYNGKRIVVFSGGTSKKEEDLYQDIKFIKQGGGNGSIIGRNVFQRPRDEAITMLNNIYDLYK